jgi:hypothetical protein
MNFQVVSDYLKGTNHKRLKLTQGIIDGEKFKLCELSLEKHLPFTMLLRK